MPYGPRFGRMSQDDVPDPKKTRKLELAANAIHERDMSWRIKTRHGEDLWAVLVYDLQWREGLSGAIIMVDRDTDMDVKVYAPGMWFDAEAVVPDESGEWVPFLPHKAYLEDLADRLITEAEEKQDDEVRAEYLNDTVRGTCSTPGCVKDEPHELPCVDFKGNTL